MHGVYRTHSAGQGFLGLHLSDRTEGAEKQRIRRPVSSLLKNKNQLDNYAHT